MKFINNSLFLIGLIPTPALALKCSLCSGFDDSLDIPTQTGMNNTSAVPASCAEVMNAAKSTDVTNSSECLMFDLLGFGFCGCTGAPPAESCFGCPNGEVLPDRALIPGRDAFASYGMDEQQLAEVEDKTCNELAFSYSFAYIMMKALMQMGNGGGNRRLNDGRLLDDDMSLEDALMQVCLPTANACGCANSVSDSCKICENGLENPDFVPTDSGSGSSDSGSGSSDSGSESADGSQDPGWNCAKGVEGMNAQAQSISASDSICDSYKEVVKDAGCVCIESSKDLDESGSESGSEDGSKGPDTAVCQECGSEDPETVGVSDKCYDAVQQYVETAQTESTKLMEACNEPENSKEVSIPCKVAILEYFECKSPTNGSYSSAITLTSAMITITTVAAMLV